MNQAGTKQLPKDVKNQKRLPVRGDERRRHAEQQLWRLSYEVRLVLLGTALVVGLVLSHMLPHSAYTYFTIATLAAMVLLAIGFLVDKHRTTLVAGAAIALMHVAWIAFALHFTGHLASPLLPLLYILVVLYSIQRDISYTGLVVGGTVVVLFVEAYALGTQNMESVRTAAGYAILLVATSFAVHKYVGWLHQAQDSAATEATRYQLMTDSAEDALLILDPQWRVLEANAAAQRFFGNGGRSKPTGQDLVDLLPLSDPEQIRPYQQQVLEGRIVSHVPLTITRTDEKKRSVLFSAMPIFENNHITSIQAAIRDVTELTEFRQQLKHVEKFAAVRHVLAAAGHALNNPLAVIRLSVQVAQMMGEEPDYKEIITQVDRCVRTIRGLEVYTAGRRDETFVTDVNEVLDQAVLLTHAQLMATGIQLEVNVPPSLPSVQGDPYSLQRSFINIITNAWEAMEDWPGERKLIIDARRLVDGVQIGFRDTGPGIPDHMIPELFKPPPVAGTDDETPGLGLPVVYATIQQAGGQVTVGPNRREGGTLVKIHLRTTEGEE